MNLLNLIGRDTPLRRTSSKNGGEYSGPCPLCRRGQDRFKVWPAQGRWACLGIKAGRAGCDRGGDAIDYLRQHDGLSYAAARAVWGWSLGIGAPASLPLPSPAPWAPPTEPLRPPSAVWQQRALAWVAYCERTLFGERGRHVRAWLAQRGLGEACMRQARLGYHPDDHYDARSLWGLSVDAAQNHGEQAGGEPHGRVWLPNGVVIPWFIDGAIWRVNVRRLLTPGQVSAGQTKYVGPAGFTNALYGADSLAPNRPVVLVEGEIDALTLVQTAGDLVAAVATGSTGGARRAGWVARLALAPLVLVAFDADANGAGDQAAGWWLNVLAKAVRLRPVGGKDVNAMHTAGIDVRAWVQAGLSAADRSKWSVKHVG